MRDLAAKHLRKAIDKHRAEKINATQRGASAEELQEIEDKMHMAIWMLMRIDEEAEG